MEAPLLQYPFPDRLSAHAPAMEKLTRLWLQQRYPSIPMSIKRRYTSTCTGYLTARFFPEARYERLVPLSMSSLWGLAFDDYYEHATARQLTVLAGRISALILGEAPLPSENEFFHQMAVMAAAFRGFMPQFWMERFAASMKRYIEGMSQEAPYKASLTFPSLETYMDIRWKSVDVLQMIDGLEVATEMSLPDAVRHHPCLEKLAWLTCRIIAWCNDYFSSSKEAGRDVMNLVLILQHELQCSLKEAVTEAVKVHDRDLTLYLELKKTLPDFGPWQTAVMKFLEYNELMIAGHWRWYLTDTKRYKAGGSPSAEAFKSIR